ncbi:Eisosome component PIL1-domain-containing protein [Leucosporidium creatinivorum]|uniref:Eisosome component PIL1-domain-containing protein n=1 Tax=Leucosporidium creatinivorum TaxID=106004 RepID=A0A1Y2FEK1_9BASI|nr:Eisosome component PIL1-domain-containing protein [Leucosporidium creatinivorum]
MSGFLKSLAHNPRVSLGPKDTRQLADVISSEKRLVEATHRLSTERIKSSIALKEWGASEGPDLNDILTKLSMLFDYLSTAEKAYAEHDANYRLQFKNIRTREENLAALKKSKNELGSKIETQDRKVSKMKEENKDLPTALQRLAEMRQEMIGLENSVMNEETSLGDFKRTTTREAMSLKLGALLELAEKTVVVGELGKLMVDEIPTDRTEPGAPRAIYNGYEKTDELMQQAQKCISDVVFNPVALHDQYGGDSATGGAPYNPNSGYAGQYDGQGQGSDEQARQADFGVNGGGHHGQQDSINYAGGGGGYQDDSWRGHQSDAYGGPDPYHGGGDHYGGTSDDPYSAARNYSSNAPYLPEIATASSLGGSLPAGARAGPPGSETEGESVVDVYNAVLSSDPSGLAVPKLDADANRSSLAYMDEGAWGNQQSGAPEQTEDLAGDNSTEARERAQAEEDERLERERAEAEEVERAEMERRGKEKEQSMRAPYRYSGSGSPNQQEVGTSAAHEQYQSRDSAPSHVEDPRSAEHGGLPYSPPPPTHNKYYPEAIERPYIPREDDGAYHGPTNSPPPSGAPSANAQPLQHQSYEQQQQQHTSLPPISTVPPAAANTSLPLSPRSPSPPATPTQPESQQQQRKPIMIRGESALGSKYGDVFVPNRAAVDGGALNSSSGSSAPQNGSTTPSYLSSAVGGGASAAATGASGYFRGNTNSDDRSTGSAEPRKVNAGAFRRAQPIGGGGGGSGGPSQADAIRDQYRSTLATAGEGELPGAASPRFDVSPLQVNKSRPVVQPRSGSLPMPQDAWASSAGDLGSSGAPPPSYGSPAAPAMMITDPHAAGPYQEARSPGFASERFVTRLD